MLPRKTEERNIINLIGVNSEKEPLVGMFPVRRLFDRSLYATRKEDKLHFCNTLMMRKLKFNTYLIMKKISNQDNTHRTWSEPTLVKTIGISPDKLLLLRRLFHATQTVVLQITIMILQ
jgi:hypothetical protein